MSSMTSSACSTAPAVSVARPPPALWCSLKIRGRPLGPVAGTGHPMKSWDTLHAYLYRPSGLLLESDDLMLQILQSQLFQTFSPILARL